MQLKEFINYRVEVVQPGDTLQQAAEKMRDLDVGSMPVCDGQSLVGIVTDRDITIRATAQGQDPTRTPVRDVMSPDVFFCFEDQEVEEAAAIMRENQIRRLFVLNEDEELVGITSLGELATVTGNRDLAGETLERISEPDEQELAEPDRRVQDDVSDEDASAELGETTVIGLFHDRLTAKQAIDDLKAAAFTSDSIFIAVNDAQESLVRETGTQALAAELMPNLPELAPGAVLLLVEADDRTAEALDVLNRHQAVPGGVRIPID